jgi:hypothetical protein
MDVAVGMALAHPAGDLDEQVLLADRSSIWSTASKRSPSKRYSSSQ